VHDYRAYPEPMGVLDAIHPPLATRAILTARIEWPHGEATPSKDVASARSTAKDGLSGELSSIFAIARS